MSLRLIGFAVGYNLVNIYFWNEIKEDQSASLGYGFIVLGFWLFSGVLLGLLIWLAKVKLNGLNLFSLLFCTPIPALVFLAIQQQGEQVVSTREYNSEDHRRREIKYTNRIEYFTSVDLVNEQNPFPATENYQLDSVSFIDDAGEVVRTEKK